MTYVEPNNKWEFGRYDFEHKGKRFSVWVRENGTVSNIGANRIDGGWTHLRPGSALYERALTAFRTA